MNYYAGKDLFHLPSYRFYASTNNRHNVRNRIKKKKNYERSSGFLRPTRGTEVDKRSTPTCN